MPPKPHWETLDQEGFESVASELCAELTDLAEQKDWQQVGLAALRITILVNNHIRTGKMSWEPQERKVKHAKA
jgi:hypothetical protein